MPEQLALFSPLALHRDRRESSHRPPDDPGADVDGLPAAQPCRCARPAVQVEDGSPRCFKCGRDRRPLTEPERAAIRTVLGVRAALNGRRGEPS